MVFRLLGPVEAELGGRPVVLGRRQERSVLAILLLDAGRPVPVASLTRLVHTGDAPADARRTIQTCVSRLRTALSATDPTVRRDWIRRCGDGYLINADPYSIDVRCFDRLLAQARAAQDPVGRGELAREALRLWRGPALANVGPDAVRERLAGPLEERRLAALDLRIAAELAAGRHGEILGELTNLTGRRPLDERLIHHLMVALYRTGRRGDALRVYRELRARMSDELGLEPGADLQRLNSAVLRDDDELHHRPVDEQVAATWPETTPGPAPAAEERPSPAPAGDPKAWRRERARPRCLPRDIGDFTGRRTELATMLEAVPQASGSLSVVQAIDGMPGIGKTTLAVHVAHKVADAFMDAQLSIDLHGHSQQAPVDPATAVNQLLRQLGVPDESIPASPEDRVALWRSELANRRVLLLLDDAASSEQVAPLLPTGTDSLTLITSRRRLTGLDAVRAVSLEVPTEQEAVALLHQIVGDRIVAELPAATAVVRLCGCLPLAVRLAGARLAYRANWTVADLLTRLRRSATLLRELAAGGRTVESAFALSYDHLGDLGRRMFRSLGVLESNDFDLSTVAALMDLSPAEADTTLTELVDAHLVEETSAARYRLHDLLREYACGLASTAG